MENGGAEWLNTGILAVLAGVIVALAKAVEIAISRIVPRRQVLSDEELRMLREMHQMTTARDEDGVPLSWFPVYARHQTEEQIELARQSVKALDRLVVVMEETKELLRDHAEELRSFRQEVG